MGTAFQIALAQADACQPGAHGLDMAWLAAMRSTGQRDVLVAQSEALDGTALDKGHGLDRLVGGARQDWRVDIAPGRNDRPVGFHHGRDALVPAFDDGSARDFDDDNAPAHALRSSLTTVTLS